MIASMRRRKTILVLLIAGIIAVVLAVAWPGQKMISRDIGCALAPLGRAKTICQALSKSMEWTWMGHAIISSGWRVTLNALRQVYCREKINPADLPALENLKRGSDWRLQDGADDLTRLISSASGRPTEPENSIFNPANPKFILKGGCPGFK